MEIITLQDMLCEEYYEDKESLSVTIGAFDGIHQGHIKIFQNLAYNDLKTAVISFKIHPDYSLNKRVNQGNIMTIEEKTKIFENYGIDYLILLEPEILKMSYIDFNNLLKRIGVKRVVVGKEFHYGYQGIGTCDTLKDDFILLSLDIQKDGQKKMSSETIRKLLQEGKVDELTTKGYPEYTITGVVEHGKALGSKLGFPTANLSMTNKYIGIKKGVYQTTVQIDDREYLGICNVGINPSTDTLANPRLEVHIIGLNEDIYNKYITVKFQKFIREEMKFTNLDDLKKQINKDIEIIKNTHI